MTIALEPIGFVQATRRTAEDDHWDRETSWIELAEGCPAESLAGLEAFSHVEVIFFMHEVAPEEVVPGARHPRGRHDWPKVGVFAQRNRKRPNRIGVTVARLKQIDGRRLLLEGLDAIDGTPVLDIKPWVREFGPRGEQSQPDWMTELMREYW